MIGPLSSSCLQANLDQLLDKVIESGEPLEIERQGRRLKIIPQIQGKLDLLKPHPEFLQVAPEEIVHIDWSKEWHP